MRFTQSQRRRLWLAVLASLLAHTLLLSMALSGSGLGIPGLGLPGRDRRADAPEVRVVMLPPRPGTPAATDPTPQAPPAPVVTGSDPDPAPAPAPAPAPRAPPEAVAEPTEPAAPTLSPPVEVTARLAALAPGAAMPANAAPPDRIALDLPRQATLTSPGELATPLAAAAPEVIASSPQRTIAPTRPAPAEVLARITPPVRERALDLSTLDRSLQDTQRQMEQVQAASAEAAKAQAEREQSARQLAARQEAERLEAARLEAARLESARLEAARLEATRQETARQEAARAAAAAQPDADTARREASRRAMGRQLDEEAARRREAEAAAAAAARQPSGLPLSWSTARRGRLLGRTDANAELVQYAEAWARKIQLNLTFDQVREAVKQRHTNPLVTVAIRQDGSVEAVTFVVSSGVAQIDAAIRRVVEGQAPYPAFPPALARDFDVVEIRRTWSFDMAIRLY